MDENNQNSGAMAVALGALGALAWQIVSSVIAQQGTEALNGAINKAKEGNKTGGGKKGKK